MGKQSQTCLSRQFIGKGVKMGLVMVKIITQTSTYPRNIKGHFAGAIFTGNGRNLTRVTDGKHQGSVSYIRRFKFMGEG